MAKRCHAYTAARCEWWYRDTSGRAASSGSTPSPSKKTSLRTTFRLSPTESRPLTAIAQCRSGRRFSLASVALNCDILIHDDGAAVAAGPLDIRGYALDGDGVGIARVEVTLEGAAPGAKPRQSLLEAPWAWPQWSLTADARLGPLSSPRPGTPSAPPARIRGAAVEPTGYVTNSWARCRVEVTEPGNVAPN